MIQKEQAFEENGAFTFPKFELSSDIFKSTTPIADKTLIIEIVECDKKNSAKTKLLVKTQIRMRDALVKAQGSHGRVNLFLLSEKNEHKGKLEISRFSVRRFYTFFDLILGNQLNIVPIVGVDFSLANLTFDCN